MKTILYIVNFLCLISFVTGVYHPPQIIGIETEKPMNDTTYSFSFSRSDYTDDITDKFHHIQFLGDVPVNRKEYRKYMNDIRKNIDTFKAEILKHPTTQKILDSLNFEIQKLGLNDSLTKNIEVDFRDHVQYYCQVHHRVCLFRNYRFIQTVKRGVNYNNVAQYGTVFVEGIPISGYPIDSVIRILGKPDSIISRYRYSNSEGKYDTYYFNNSSFYIDEGRSSSHLESIDLTSRDLQININGRIFNQHTTLDEIKKIYPLSYLNKYPNNNKTEYYDTSITVFLGQDEIVFDVSGLYFRFKNEKLIIFEYYSRWD